MDGGDSLRDTAEESSVDETMPPSLEELQKTKSWLKNQLLEHKAAALAQSETHSKTQDDDPEILLERIVQLQKELQELSGMNSVKDLMLERAQLGQALVSALYPPRAQQPDAGSGDAQTNEPDKELVSLLEQQENVSTEILTHHEAIQEIQPRLDKLQKENLATKTANRELMANLVALKEEQKTHSALTEHNEKIARAQEKKGELVCKLEVMRGVFRRLIIGSGVDWGSDPALTKTLLDLGTPLDELLTADLT